MASSGVRTVMRAGTRFYEFAAANTGAAHAQYPSVTSVLNVINKPGLLPWAVKTTADTFTGQLRKAKDSGELVREPERALQEAHDRAMHATEAIKTSAANFGTLIHEHVDAVIAGRDVDTEGMADGMRRVVEGFIRWHDASGLDVDPRGDTVVRSDRYQYAGAVDAIGRRKSDGGLVVLDFKTSNFVHDSYALQLAAYANAIEEMGMAGDAGVVDAMVVRLDKATGDVDTIRVRDLSAAFDAFKAALLLWRVTDRGNLLDRRGSKW